MFCYCASLITMHWTFPAQLLRSTLSVEMIIDKMLDWFCVNKMKANSDKISVYSAFNGNGLLNDEHVRIGNIEVKAEKNISCVHALCCVLVPAYLDELCRKN